MPSFQALQPGQPRQDPPQLQRPQPGAAGAAAGGAAVQGRQVFARRVRRGGRQAGRLLLLLTR